MPLLCSPLLIVAIAAAKYSALDFDGKVDQLREETIRKLKAAQSYNGNWNVADFGDSGWHAIALLAVLEADVPPNDLTVRKALRILRQLRPETTIGVSLQTLALCRANEAQDKKSILRNLNWLTKAAIRVAGAIKGWFPDGRPTIAYQFLSQFAVAALHEASRLGLLTRV